MVTITNFVPSNMKYSIFLYLILLIFITLASDFCRKEPECACGVKHPEENITWLKAILGNAFNVNVYKLLYENVEYIVISEFPGPDSISVAYDCNGNKICENGGFNPGGNFCSLQNAADFWRVFEKEKTLIYVCKY